MDGIDSTTKIQEAADLFTKTDWNKFEHFKVVPSEDTLNRELIAERLIEVRDVIANINSNYERLMAIANTSDFSAEATRLQSSGERLGGVLKEILHVVKPTLTIKFVEEDEEKAAYPE